MHFHDFSDLSPTEYMDQVVGELKRLLLAGSVKVGLSPDVVTKYLLLGPGAAFIDDSASDAAAKALIRAQGDNIKKLDTTFRARVLSGAKSMKWWTDFAKVVGDAIAYATQVSWDSSLIALAPSSVVLAGKKTADDVIDLGKKAAPYVAGAVGGGIFLYAAGAVVGTVLLNKLLGGGK